MIGLCTLSSGGNAGLPSDQGSTARSAVSISGWKNPDKGQMVDHVRSALTRVWSVKCSTRGANG